jgi:hypothetical protein
MKNKKKGRKKKNNAEIYYNPSTQERTRRYKSSFGAEGVRPADAVYKGGVAAAIIPTAGRNVQFHLSPSSTNDALQLAAPPYPIIREWIPSVYM